ncbi:hypothetical protein ACTFIR_007772 [Dictyostelium discoideum]
MPPQSSSINIHNHLLIKHHKINNTTTNLGNASAKVSVNIVKDNDTSIDCIFGINNQIYKLNYQNQNQNHQISNIQLNNVMKTTQMIHQAMITQVIHYRHQVLTTQVIQTI